MVQGRLTGSKTRTPGHRAGQGDQAKAAEDTIMEKPCCSEDRDILKLASLSKPGAARSSSKAEWPRRRFWPFHAGLAIHDVVMAFSGLWITNWLLGLPFTGSGAATAHFVLAVQTLLILSFFPVYHLYSYHLVFSRIKHRQALSRAMAYGVLSLSLVIGYFAFPSLRADFPMGSWALLGGGIAGGILLVLYSVQSLHGILRALGVALIGAWILEWTPYGQGAFVYAQAWSLPFGMLFATVLLGAGRAFVLGTVYNRWLRRYYRRQVAIIGSNQAAKEITSQVVAHNAPFWVAGLIGCGDSLGTTIAKECLGDIVELPHLVKSNQLSDIILTEERMDKRTLISLLDFGLSNGVTIWFSPSLLPIIDRKIYSDNFCGIPMIKMCSQTRTALFNRVKYALDALVALPLFVMLLPLFGVIALAIKINSRGPVFYRPIAIGRNGEQFKMFKFRSMRVNSDPGIHKEFVTKLIKGEIGGEGADGGKKPLKITDDARVTVVGRILRTYSLDELPQLFNVLLGQMSLIGPRPGLPYEFDVYQDWYKKRVAIRPGITGLWQVAGRSEVAFEEMILLDLYYLYNRSLWLDLNILLETVFVVLSKKGAY